MTSRGKLTLDKANAKFLGVCAGLAGYLGIEILWVRLAAVVVTLLGSGIPALVYLVIAGFAGARPQDRGSTAADQGSSGTIR